MSKHASGRGGSAGRRSGRLPTSRLPVLPTLALLLAGACARGEPAPGVPAAAPSAPVEMKDSLVLNAPGGVAIWMTTGRPATDSKGATCVERSLEIRRADGSKTPVPLLYTVSAPSLHNDSTMKAELAKNCHAGDVYHVNLRTGQPTKVVP